MGNEKRVKPSRSFGTVLYFVLVIALIIGTNVFSLVRRLNYYVYQSTPYDVEAIGGKP